MSKKDTPAIPTIETASDLSCGLIMPISAIDGCSSSHWEEVKNIVIEAIENISSIQFKVKLVSDADDIGVIQKRIVQNIYSSDIIVCDVSGKNPNVMFELGMRLAFDKPTVIIKDDHTDYSFDTGIIEHVPYPRDLRFSRIVEFKKILAEKTSKTYSSSLADPNHSTFLKNFGKFQVATLNQTELPLDRMILETLHEIQYDVSNLKRRSGLSSRSVRLGTELDSTKLIDDNFSKVVDAVLEFQKEYKVKDLLNLYERDDFRAAIIEKCNAGTLYTNESDFTRDLRIAVEIVSHIKSNS